MNVFTPRQKILSAVLKTTVIISAIAGTVLSAYAGKRVFMGGSRVFMYFTIQSNIVIAAVCAYGLRYLYGKRTPGRLWWIVKYVVTVSITLTGAVFCLILAPTIGNAAWNIQNTLTHVVVPAAAILDFFVVGVSSDISRRSTLWVTVPPVLYVIYAGIGYVCGWQFADGINYPYFFLNWGSRAGAFGFTDELPFMGCVWWILLLLAGLLTVGYLYLRLIDILKKLTHG